MNEMKHTKEPWRIDAGPRHYYIKGDDGQNVALMAHPDTDNGYPVATADLNATRIVACVNALAGVAEPEKAIKEAREALKAAESELRDLYYDHPVRIQIRKALEAI
jgi:hypothetical protein